MIRKAQISVPLPCHENWEAMTAAEKGKFCGSCQKNVYDFTKSSDRIILEKLSTEKDLCGRFLDSQLNRQLIAPKEKSSLWLAAATGVITLLGFGTNEIKAQVKQPTVQTDRSNRIILGKPLQQRKLEKIISGIVVDRNGNPVQGFEISSRGTAQRVKTDVNGKFSLRAIVGEILIGLSEGEHTLEFVVDEKTFYTIKVQTAVIMGKFGEVHVDEPIKSGILPTVRRLLKT